MAVMNQEGMKKKSLSINLWVIGEEKAQLRNPCCITDEQKSQIP